MFRPTALALAITLSACGEPAQPADLSVSDLHVVEPIGGRDIARGGLMIKGGSEAMRLTGIASPNAERVELHTHAMTDAGVMQMRKVDGIDIPAGETVMFEAGGKHLMFFGFDKALAPGDETEVTLTFIDSEGAPWDLKFNAPVIALGADIGEDTPAHGS
ncbi:MAG: copper chaperone PCu(A)C [Pseudomonadota bacterium]